ncbi:uncharacterized protein LOC141620503 [Silene latifolia]|uniref:uncharacterized protein LOC141620503 n=1 Tax=Silene latifolia TaxID=37657 RepID=UPI003D7725C4
MFILPNGVIARIKAICKNFFWDGGVDFHMSPLVSWDKVCRPKIEGGLGLKNDIIWNKAAVGKLVWWIALKSDHLWVRWVNHTYIKGRAWQDYSATASSSWYWRKIWQMKILLNDPYEQQVRTSQKGKEYSISKGYDFFRNKGDKVNWSGLVWNKWTIPKHGFLTWLQHHNSLNTNKKLHRLGVSDEVTCHICGSCVENNDHLFYKCIYSQKVLKQVSKWIHIELPIQDIMNWRLKQKGSKLKKGITNAVLNACSYHIWRQRNQSRIELTLTKPDKVAREIVKEMKGRIRYIISSSLDDGDEVQVLFGLAFTRVLGLDGFRWPVFMLVWFDVGLITSSRDGLNLVNYEFLACHATKKKSKKKSVLIVSQIHR